VQGKDIHEILVTRFRTTLSVVPSNEGYKVFLAFRDYMGDPVEVFVLSTPDRVIVEDFGHSAGLLFSLGLQSEENPAHQLIRNLSDAYHITMDYDTGVLKYEVSPADFVSGFLDFAKVLISLQTVLPELQRRRREARGRRRLATRLGEAVKQLKLPVEVQRQVEVEGRHEAWSIDYRYARNHGPEAIDVLILAAEFNIKEPRKTAEHALTLAVDILDRGHKRDLRIVYDVDGNESTAAAQRAAMLIDDYQGRVGYRAYNYANLEDRTQLMALIIQELSPLTEK